MHPSGDAQVIERALERSIDLSWTPRIELRHKPAEETQIHCTVQPQAQGATAGKANCAGNLNVGVRAAQLCLIDFQAFPRRTEMDGPRVFQPHIRIIQHEARESCIRDDVLRLFQGAGNGNVTVGHSVTAERPKMERALQKGVQVDVLDRDFTVQREWIGITQRDLTGDTARSHRGTELEFCLLSIRRKAPVEAADHVLPHAEVYDAESSFALRCRCRSASSESESDQPSNGEPRRLQLFKVLERKRRADQIRRYRAIR